MEAHLLFPAGIYPILDVDACNARNVHPARLVKLWKSLGWGPYQLRAKQFHAGEYIELAEKLQEAWSAAPSGKEANRWMDRPCIIANDFIDAAWHRSDLFCGVHCGQSDARKMGNREKEQIHQIREVGGICGFSTHSEEEFRIAISDSRWSYVALGPVFSTNSKTHSSDQSDALGIEATGRILEKYWREASDPAAVVIGGLDLDRYQECRRSWNVRPIPAMIAAVIDESSCRRLADGPLQGVA